MAIVKSAENKIKSNSSMMKVLEYIVNPKKAQFVSCRNCSGPPEMIYEQFLISQKFQKRNQASGIKAHHYVQSFSPEDNVTPEQAHEIAVKMMERAAPNYQYVITTHVDKEHIHNHIVINSVNPLTGYKWHDNKSAVKHLREISDSLCREMNLSVIGESKNNGLDQSTYQLAMKGKSWKVNLCADLDEAVKCCTSKFEFIDFLNKKGYKVNYRDVHILITKDGEKKGIRVDTLAKQFGEKYKKINLENAMGFHSAVGNKFIEQRKNFGKQKKPADKKTPEYKTEWQRYEDWFFDKYSENVKRKKAVSYCLPNIFYTTHLEIFLLRLLFYIFFSRPGYKRAPCPAEKKKYKVKEKKSAPIRRVCASGNISRRELLSAYGKNFYVRADTLQLLKLSGADFFYIAKVDVNKKIAYVTIKEENRQKLSELIQVPLEELEKQNEEYQNRRMYSLIKKSAAEKNEKPEYRIVTEEMLEKVKGIGIDFAYFKKEDGKINIAFLNRDKEKINSIVFEKRQSLNK